MRYLPVFLEIAEGSCVVIGGGQVAARRVEALLRPNAKLAVVSQQLCCRLQASVESGPVRYLARGYARGDLRACTLCYATLDDPEMARTIACEAQELAPSGQL